MNTEKLNTVSLFAGVAAVMGAFMFMQNRDREAFREFVEDKQITDPRAVWDACLKYRHAERERLVEAEARVADVQEIVRVADGLRAVRTMVLDPNVPDLVRRTILAHWYEQLAKLLVSWGVVFLPEEVVILDDETAELLPAFRREGALRAEVAKLRTLVEFQNKLLEQRMQHVELPSPEPESST